MPSAESLLLLAVLWDAQIVRWVVWVGLVVFTVALLVLVRTRWGQSQPLSKCIVLSLVAHLLLGIYMTTVNIVTHNVGSPDGKGIQVALVDSSGGDSTSEDAESREAWDALVGIESPADLAMKASVPTLSPIALPPEPARKPSLETSRPLVPITPPPAPPAEEPVPPAPATTPLIASRAMIKSAEPIVVPAKPAEDVPPADPAGGPPVDTDPKPPMPAPGVAPKLEGGAPRATDGSSTPGGGGTAVVPPAKNPAPSLPHELEHRVGDHLDVAKGFGATQDSEARVKAALKWLANNQSDGGRWEARRLSGGAGLAADRQDRQAAGAQADSGITGLALLAYLAAGHTHLQGPHQTTVRRGLEFLLASQDANGCLGSTPNQYERMYCHAMATCALSEAYAMTRDERLGPGVRRAIGYTLSSQDRVTGGWRYHPGDPGDTSQLGWQVMALKSAELAGIEMPPATREGISRFLKSVTAGHSGGLARYQPARGVPSRSMTAEAMVCRQFLGVPMSSTAIDEATGYLLEEPPGAGQANLYYWYYGTLGTYQLQGDAWQRWNAALQKNLLATQRTDGELAGSWDPDPVWGGCGGRAYSTALSALCLEVYYRFLPLYAHSGNGDRRTK